jgi:hypothetical protein
LAEKAGQNVNGADVNACGPLADGLALQGTNIRAKYVCRSYNILSGYWTVRKVVVIDDAHESECAGAANDLLNMTSKLSTGVGTICVPSFVRCNCINQHDPLLTSISM